MGAGLTFYEVWQAELVARALTEMGLAIATNSPFNNSQFNSIWGFSVQIGGFQFKLGVLVQIGGSTSYAACVCCLCPPPSVRARLCSPSCACVRLVVWCRLHPLSCVRARPCVPTHRSGRRSRPCAARGTPHSRTCSPRAADATGCASPPPRRSAPPQSPPRAPSGRWRS